MRRFAALGAVLLAIGAAVVLAPAPEEEPLTPGQIERVRDQVDAARDSLGREGVYLAWTGISSRRCLDVAFYNPTRANRERVEDQFPRTCAVRERHGQMYACTALNPVPVAVGPVVVPDVRRLGLHEATRRLVRAGLAFDLSCHPQRRAERPAASSPDKHLRIVSQCPRPGERVERGSVVGLTARGMLPGGFEHRLSHLTQSRRPCADGRNSEPVVFRGERPRPRFVGRPRLRFRREAGRVTYTLLVRTDRALPPPGRAGVEDLLYLGATAPLAPARRVPGSRHCYTARFRDQFLTGDASESEEVVLGANQYDEAAYDVVDPRPDTGIRRELRRMGCFG